MGKSVFLLTVAAGLSACGQSSDQSASNAAANSAAAKPEKPAYCFFKDAETKGWKAVVDKQGNVVVSGKAYREDARYKALLGPAKVSGATAEVAPTITSNDTGYAAPGNWWDVSAAIPASTAVERVVVKCGAKTIIELQVPRKG